MFRRYVLASVVIMIIAVATAGIAYKAGHKLTYTAGCVMQAFVRAPATSQPAANPDFIAFTNALAATQVAQATPVVSATVAKKDHLRIGELAGKFGIQPTFGIGSFRVQIRDDRPDRAKRLANDTCETFVSVMTDQRKAELTRNSTTVEQRLKSIEADLKRLLAVPLKRRTTSQQISIGTDREALKINTVLAAALKSMPPDNIAVLTPSQSAAPTQTTSLKKYLLIALLAGLLVIFLFVLVVEALAQPATTRSRADQD